jgi:hypothetical protein
MIEEEGPLFEPGRDHNKPPMLLEIEPARTDLREWLTERLQRGDKTFAQRKAEFLRAAGAAVVRNRETAGAAADVIKLASAVKKEIDAERLSRSNPYRQVADALVREIEEFWHEVDAAMERLRDMIDAWTAHEDELIERQRLEQEQEQREMRERARVMDAMTAPIPAAARPEPARKRPIRGDYGARVSAAERKVYAIEDVRKLPDWVLDAPVVRDAILQVVRQTAKHMGDIPGIRVSIETENQIR